MIAQCIFVATVLAVSLAMPVTQEEYARYIAQQQTQRLEQPEKPNQPIRRPVQLVQLVSSGGPAYQSQQPTAARLAYQPATAAYQPQPSYQPAVPAAYQPQPSYQSAAAAAYQPQPSYQQGAQAYQQSEEYQQPEQLYQPGPARAQAAPRPKAPSKPKSLNRPEKPEDEENDNNPNAQYQFSFDISDDESTNYHNRKEQRDGEKISGSYSVVDSDGFIRTVTYTADPEEGFKAEVSREPTNIQVKIPTPAPQTASPGPSTQYRLPERKPQYISVQASEPESIAAQPADPISGYYRAVPQQVKAPGHRFAVPRQSSVQLQAGKSAGLVYAAVPAPANSPASIYQAYQQQ